VKPHQAIDGKTQEDKSNIKVKDGNKWIGLLKNSVKEGLV